MSKNIPFVLFFLAVFVLVACSTVPITGRRQLSLVSPDQVMAMSYQSYDEFLRKNELSNDRMSKEMVHRVGTNIQNAVERYMADTGQAHLLEGYKWEFNLVENKEENAFCMPGGKVVVNTGILPVTKNDTGLSVVLGHEIAHAVANHGSERISQQLAVQLGGVAFDYALAQSGGQAHQIFMSAYGLGSTVGVILPFSRLHESEADQLGLIFMAMAGYDPREAVLFWERMASSETNKPAPPEFLSTHPAGSTRIENIKRLIPDAMRYYRP